MIKKMLKLFRSLPPEIRMLLAMAGLASPFGMVYLLRRVFFPKMSLMMVIFIVAGVLAGLALIGFVIAKIFGRRGKRRQKKMVDELAREDTQAPAAVDVRASIKANNDKYFAAIRDMRKNLGVSVYDLPWYIVMGDSGCGKTRLINNGGLTFGMGRPEGYQLGTLNYNWWFTEDAVFIDMAGRLCNPQEDADHREWQAFLDTIAKGRRGFPINGAVVCISAEHLLQDSPQKQEADANTTLERLREMQAKLGVTFATYLVVTKCDKILGFMQFFDRAVRDIIVMNQIFGWSKSGAFNELYDPEGFGRDFDGVYHRLNELRMRRLHDDIDEIDRGLAYSFPEEFRELRDPLQTYLRTLFPPIKNPRAIKNLIFRGIYFTSATQEGELILKHLAERLGSEAASQFPTLDTLYPEKRPLFVKDVLFKKVFPEHGLVFRNEEDVIRNRQLAKLLKIGSVALALVLVAALWWSSWKFSNLINAPRDHAREAPVKQNEPLVALGAVTELGADVATLRVNRLPALVLSLFVGADEPIRDLTTIQGRLFENGVLRPALGDIGAALRAGARAGAKDPVADEAAERHRAALAEYVTWLGCMQEASVPEQVNYDSFEKMVAVITDDRAMALSKPETFTEEAHEYFTVIKNQDAWKDPARFLNDPGLDPEGTIREALCQVDKHLQARYALLDEQSINESVREWMRIQSQCATITRTYDAMVNADLGAIRTTQEFRDFTSQFLHNHDEFEASLEAVRWKRGEGGRFEKIPSLKQLILDLRNTWVAYDRVLVEAYLRCGRHSEEEAKALLPSLRRGNREAQLAGLDAVLWNSMKRAGLTECDYEEGSFDDGHFDQLVKEVYDAFPHIISFVRADEAGTGPSADGVVLTPSSGEVRGVLAQIRARFEGVEREPPDGGAGETAAAWQEELIEVLYPQEGARRAALPGDLDEAWRPAALAQLSDGHLELIRLSEGLRLLERIDGRLELESRSGGGWGYAELASGWRGPVKSSYAMDLPTAAERVMERTPRPEARRPTARKPQPAERPSARRRQSRTDREPPPTRRRTQEHGGEIPVCATPTFLGERAVECVELMYFLREFGARGHYLRSDEGSLPLHEYCIERIRSAWERYADAYAREWRAAYDARSLLGLKDFETRDDDWEVFARRFSGERDRRDIDPRRVADELEPALREALQATRWATYLPGDGWWADDRDMPDQWRDTIEAFDTAMQRSWGAESFALTAVSDPATKAPHEEAWVALAREFGERWQDLSEAIGNSTGLEERFRTDTRKHEFGTIPWGRIEALRREVRLDDEKLTAELVRFEEEAQQLLSEELTDILWNIQREHLPPKTPPDGWPFVGSAGDAAEVLTTIDFSSFKKFLAEVARARQMFAQLEDGLPDDEVQRARAQFYQQCQAWYAFLDLSGDVRTGLVAGSLEMEIQGDDPMADRCFKRKIDDAAQQYYHDVELNLGFKTTGTDVGQGGTPPGAIRIGTHHERKGVRHKRLWDWEEQQEGERELSVSLLGLLEAGRGLAGIVGDDARRSLGTSSPLALCVYLYSYGYGEGPVWRTLCEFPHPAKEGQQIGEMFVFNLSRPMPVPIKVLQPARLSGGSEVR